MTSTRIGPALHWTRAGAGPPLLLLHGLGTTSADFAALAPRLERDYEVLTVDLPGFGGSPPLIDRPTVGAIAAAIAADLDVLGLPRVHMFGNSLGARVALELAKQGRAASVVAVAPPGLNLPAERVYQALSLGLTRVLARGLRPVVTRMAGNRLGRTALLANLRSRPWEASEVEARALLAGAGDSRGYWRLLWWSILADAPTGLEQIPCPVVLAQGTADWIAAGQTPRFLLAIPGAMFRPLPGAGHAPQSDAPEALAALVAAAVGAAAEQRVALPSAGLRRTSRAVPACGSPG